MIAPSDPTAEIRWPDIDSFGHVHHVALLALLEHVRSKWLDALFEQNAWDYVLARIECDYCGELRFGDGQVRGRFAVERIGSSSIALQEVLLTQDGERLVTSGRTVLVAWDAAKRATRPISREERQRLTSHLASDTDDGAATRRLGTERPESDRSAARP